METYFRRVVLFVGSTFLTLAGACAPISSPPSMPDPGGVPVPDVIQQVKCELMHAIAAPMRRKDIAWFRSFAAKIDLTLNVGTLNQLNPTVVFANPLHNAYPNLGPSSLGGSTISAVQQKFTFGLGGGVADTRARAEDMTFTVGFLDLEKDFKALAKIDRRFEECLDPNATLTFSNLDLKSWLDRRVLPLVETVGGYQILKEGHAVLVAGAAGHPATPPTIVKPFEATPGIPDALKAAAFAAQAADYVTKQLLPIAQKLGPTCANQVLADSTLVADASVTATTQSNIAVSAHLANSGQPPDAKETAAIAAAMNAGYTAETIAKEAYGTLINPKICTAQPPAPKAPPFDTISANYTFTVSANIGIAPSWTLVHVTGPSGTGSAASTAGAWTNNLSVILAPTTPSSVNQDVNNQRLIQTLRPPTVPTLVAPF
jgi:hypothetical protein